MKNIGAHLSISGGIYNLFDRANEININVIQCFTASNLQFNFKRNIDEKILEKYLEIKKENSDKKIFSHACYLINLASDDEELRKKSELILLAELYRCKEMEIIGTSFHPGSFKDKKTGIDRVANSMINIIEKFNSDSVKLLIEPSAGAGSTLPSKIEETAELYNKLHKYHKYIGITLDTCHAHAAEADFSNEESQSEYLKNFDKEIGLDKIKLIHFNDSKEKALSKKDRHENIGKGTIGKSGLKKILNNKDFHNIPKILETPPDEENGYLEDLKTIKNLLD